MRSYKTKLEKGKALIIGKDTGDKMIVDGIVLHSAFTVSDKV